MFDLEANKPIALRLIDTFNGRRLDLLEDVLHPEIPGPRNLSLPAHMLDNCLILRGADGYGEARLSRVFDARRHERYPAAVLVAKPEDDVVEGSSTSMRSRVGSLGGRVR
jgi:hypothetical protein